MAGVVYSFVAWFLPCSCCTPDPPKPKSQGPVVTLKNPPPSDQQPISQTPSQAPSKHSQSQPHSKKDGQLTDMEQV